MIEASDNDDATDLWDQVGGAPAVQAFDDRVGMSQTTAGADWGLTTTTPRDQLTLLKLIMLPNKVLSESSRVFAYELMLHVIPDDYWGISAGPVKGVRVALKNGWLPYRGSWQINSVGLVRGSGRDYLIAVMTDGSPTEEYGIGTVERISRAAWHTLRAPRAHRA
jgi:beta-lactamase class A